MYKGQCAFYAASAFAIASFSSNTAIGNSNTAVEVVCNVCQVCAPSCFVPT